MAILMDGRKLAQKIRKNLKAKTEYLKEKGVEPQLAVIMVGNDSASQIYVKNKKRIAEKVGIKTIDVHLPEDSSEEEVLQLIYDYNENPAVHGILVQLPLPSQINEAHVTHAILPMKDVDGFHPVNMGHLFLNEAHSLPCTPRGIMELFKEYEIDPAGKNVVIVGRSNIVGRPMAALMLNADATVTITHSKTRNLKQLTQQADILIVAVGKPNFITGDYIKDQAIVIDVGMDRAADGSLVGDVDEATVEPKASYLTPVPGGVGPMTIAMLMKQTVEFAERSLSNGK